MEAKEASTRSYTFIQILSLITCIAIPLPACLVMSWTTVLPKLEEDTTNFTATKEDVSWLVSIINIIGIVVSFFAGTIMELFGPKRVMLIAMFPMAAIWLMIAFSPYLPLLFLGRAAQAVTMTILNIAHHPLTAELSPTKIRGFIAASSEIVASFSLMTGYILAHFFSWKMATALSAIPCVPVFILLIFVPESPYWLLRKDRKEDAKKTLNRLMGPGQHVEMQLESMSKDTPKNKGTVREQISLLRERENRIPLMILWLIFLCRECGGKTALFSYSVYMFRQADVAIDPFVCTILVGAIRLVSGIVTGLSTDCVGRKPFLISSSFMCGVTVGLTGIFIHFELPGKEWACLVLLLIFVVFFGLGMGPIPWTYTGELIPTPVRSLGAGFIIFSYNIMSFIINYTYFKIIDQLGLGLTLMVFSIPNFLVLFVTAVWLPETKGKSLEELQTIFKKQ